MFCALDAKDSRLIMIYVSCMLSMEFAFVYCQRSGDHGAVRERGRFGGIRIL